MLDNAEVRISLHFRGTFGFLMVKRPDSETRLLPIGFVDVEPIEVMVPIFADDSQALALMMLPQQQQYYFLAAVGSGSVHPLHFPVS